MTDDVLEQLRAVQPMPRGERLSRFCVSCRDGRPDDTFDPLWERLLRRGRLYSFSTASPRLWRDFPKEKGDAK